MSKIEWTSKTWNPVAGCTWASPGCDHCYAATMTRRLEKMGQAAYAGLTTAKHFNGVMRTRPDRLKEPLSWKKPQMVFVNSMSDLFHKDVPFEFIDQVFATMAVANQHTFQVLTKRAERMCEYMTSRSKSSKYWEAAAREIGWSLRWENEGVSHPLCPFPLPNVWLGVSVEDQQRADERIPHLLKTPAAIRFLSCEPLVGPVILHKYFAQCKCGHGHGFTVCPNTGGVAKTCERSECRELKPKIDWVICGGESGHGARPCNIEWIRSIRDQCKAAVVACFVKQLGAVPFMPGSGGERFDWPCGYEVRDMTTWLKLKSKKGGDMTTWPEDLRVREFPKVKVPT